MGIVVLGKRWSYWDLLLCVGGSIVGEHTGYRPAGMGKVIDRLAHKSLYRVSM